MALLWWSCYLTNVANINVLSNLTLGGFQTHHVTEGPIQQNKKIYKKDTANKQPLEAGYSGAQGEGAQP